MNPKRHHGLKSILNEPVAPYFADALNTLSSVVQALALGIYGYELTEHFFTHNNSPVLAFETVQFVIMFLVVCVLWQRYITHNQLYGWTLGALDTIIPIGFGLLEVLLILTIQTGNLNYFSFWFAWIATWGFVAYLNTYFKFKNPMSRLAYEEHFAEYEPGFAKSFFDEVKRFEDKSLKELALAFTLLWGCDLIIYLGWFPLIVQKAIFSVLSIVILLNLLLFDVWKHLIQSPKLNHYPFWAKIKRSQDARKRRAWKRAILSIVKACRFVTR